MILLVISFLYDSSLVLLNEFIQTLERKLLNLNLMMVIKGSERLIIR